MNLLSCYSSNKEVVWIGITVIAIWQKAVLFSVTEKRQDFDPLNAVEQCKPTNDSARDIWVACMASWLTRWTMALQILSVFGSYLFIFSFIHP